MMIPIGFPIIGSNSGSKEISGITLRDYFIAHAPADPQPWFSPVVSSMPKKTPSEIEAWKEEFERQKYVQWPAAWADAMLEAREK